MATDFALIGGDLRNVKLMEILASTGNNIYSYGLLPTTKKSEITLCKSPEEASSWARCVIGPVPFNVGTVPGKSILQALSSGQIFIGGKIPLDFREDAQKKEVRVIDILQRDDMAILNAVPTAEGAIQVAMEKLPVTINKCSTLITGYGKVAKALAARIKALGGLVTICARKNKDLASAECNGYEYMNFIELPKYIGNFTLLYNTVPHLIFDKILLKNVAEHRTGDRPLVVDLASSPGGVDFAAAKEYGIETVHALSLPGKVAPETAAKNMAKVIFNIIKELTEEATESVN